jgi:hypothetical protein
MQELSSCSRSRTFCSADAGRFRKNLKIKMTGKTAGVLPMGRGDHSLFFIAYCLFFIANSLILLL